MKIRHVFILTIVITVIVSLACISVFPSLQDFMEYNTLWNGVRHSLNSMNAGTIDTSQELTNVNSNNILICIPYIQYSNSELDGLKTFVNNGGKLILMDDYGYGNSVLQYLNLDCRFSGAPLLDPLFCYKNQWLPEIIDFAPSVSKGLKEIILNHATALTNTGTIETLAWSSSGSFLDRNGNETWDKGEPQGPLPVAARQQLGKGEIILVSDPSILINSMLGRGDNAQFMKNLIGPETTSVQILLDTSHLVKKPMDITKTRLNQIKNVLSQPYVVLALILIIFLLTSLYLLRIGGSVGRKS